MFDWTEMTFFCFRDVFHWGGLNFNIFYNYFFHFLNFIVIVVDFLHAITLMTQLLVMISIFCYNNYLLHSKNYFPLNLIAS